MYGKCAIFRIEEKLFKMIVRTRAKERVVRSNLFAVQSLKHGNLDQCTFFDLIWTFDIFF
jgi:hypothetical protein